MEELKTEIKQIKNQILVGIKEDKIDYTWGKMIVDTCDKALNLHGVGNLLKDKESQTFEDWMEEHCVKLGKYYQYKFEDVLYTEEQLLQKYNTYKLSL